MTPFYRENNILFRITSADALSRFKKTQTLSFLQITRKDVEFARESKEVLLLSYDRFSNWLYRMERSFLMSHRGALPEDIKQTAFTTFIDELNLVEEICDRHPAVFSGDIRKFVKIIHHYSASIIKQKFAEILEQDQDYAYASMVDLISDYLQHILLTMHEYNNNVVKHKSKFIGISDFCLISDKHTVLLDRITFFREALNCDTFVIKNFSKSSLTEIRSVVKSLSIEGVTLCEEDIS